MEAFEGNLSLTTKMGVARTSVFTILPVVGARVAASQGWFLEGWWVVVDTQGNIEFQGSS